jgi:hypothetical protein
LPSMYPNAQLKKSHPASNHRPTWQRVKEDI